MMQAQFRDWLSHVNELSVKQCAEALSALSRQDAATPNKETVTAAQTPARLSAGIPVFLKQSSELPWKRHGELCPSDDALADALEQIPTGYRWLFRLPTLHRHLGCAMKFRIGTRRNACMVACMTVNSCYSKLKRHGFRRRQHPYLHWFHMAAISVAPQWLV